MEEPSMYPPIEHTNEECTCEGKFCRRCKQTKCLGHMVFRKKDTKKVYETLCRLCKNEEARIWRKNNPDKANEAQKRWLSKRDELDKLQPEKQSLKQSKRERAKIWNKAHPERTREHNRAWVSSHREYLQTRSRVYRRDYYNRPGMKERYLGYVRNRRSRKKAITGTHTQQQIQEQLKRQHHKCYYCQKRLQKVKDKYIYHIEHTFPLSRVAGTDIPANSIDYLVIACPTCNLSKNNKFPWEWPEGGRLL